MDCLSGFDYGMVVVAGMVWFEYFLTTVHIDWCENKNHPVRECYISEMALLRRKMGRVILLDEEKSTLYNSGEQKSILECTTHETIR